MTEPLAGLARPLAVVAAVAVLAGCASSGSSPPGGRATGSVVLTTRGARATLQGDPTSVAGSVEEVFRVLDIDLTQLNVDRDGGTVEGQAGLDRVFVELSPESERHTRVEVRVRTPSTNRWDRAAARGILEEVRRWQAS